MLVLEVVLSAVWECSWNGAHSSVEVQCSTQPHPISLNSGQQGKRCCSPAALGQHRAELFSLTCPKSITNTVSAEESALLTPQGSGRKRQSLLGQKLAELINQSAQNGCGERRCHLLLPFVMSMLEHFSRNRETEETKSHLTPQAELQQDTFWRKKTFWSHS